MKQLLTVLVIFSITSVLFISCSNSASESGTNTATETKSTFDLSAATKTIDSTNELFGNLVSKRDTVAIAALYASDAKLMGYNMPAQSGRAAIQSAFAGMLNSGVAGVKITATEVWGAEPLVAEEGTFSLTAKDGKEIDHGKYIVLWKMEDGKWKLFRDCFNSDLPCVSPAK